MQTNTLQNEGITFVVLGIPWDFYGILQIARCCFKLNHERIKQIRQHKRDNGIQDVFTTGYIKRNCDNSNVKMQNRH